MDGHPVVLGLQFGDFLIAPAAHTGLPFNRIAESHYDTYYHHHESAGHEYEFPVPFHKKLGIGKGKNGNCSKHSINYGSAHTGHESGLMPFAEALLNNENGYRPYRHRSADSDYESFYYIEKLYVKLHRDG